MRKKNLKKSFKSFCVLMVSTLQSESNDPSSSLGKNVFWFLLDLMKHFLLFSSVYTNDLMRSTYLDYCLRAAYLPFFWAVNVGKTNVNYGKFLFLEK